MTDLSKYKDAWEQAEVKRSGNVPEGKYQASIESALIKQLDWMEHPQLSLECKVLKGEWTGSKFYAQWSFHTDPRRMGILKSAIASLDMIPPVDPGTLESRLEDMLGRVYTFTVKHNPNPNNPDKPYVNVYVGQFAGMKDEIMAEMSEAQLDDLKF